MKAERAEEPRRHFVAQVAETVYRLGRNEPCGCGRGKIYFCDLALAHHKRPGVGRTDKKFESHCRVHFHVLSTGFNVLIPFGWAQIRPPPPHATASNRRPAREGPRGQTERTHLDLVGGPPPHSSRGVEAEDQTNHPCSKRAGTRDGGSAAGLR